MDMLSVVVVNFCLGERCFFLSFFHLRSRSF